MTRILIIAPDIPYPLTKGGRQGMFHFIDRLRFEYEFSFLFILNNNTSEGFEELKNRWDNVNFYPYKEKQPIQKTQSLFSKIYNFPYRLKQILTSKKDGQSQLENIDFVREHSTLHNSIPYQLSPQFITYVKNIANLGFDKIQVDFFPLISLAHILPPSSEKIFIHHELRYVRNYIEMTYFKEVNAYDEYIFKVSKQLEIGSLNLYDKVVTVTDIDKDKLEKEAITTEIVSSPPIIIKPDIEDKHTPYLFNNKLTFIGSPGHFPNYDAINWFLKDIWPKITKVHPSIELHIIGQGWNLEMFKDIPSFNNVIFDGYIKDLKDILPNTISIVPIRIGSGMRMKIIDSVNYRIPFITTSVGVEGLDFIDNKDCFIADDSTSFIEKLNLLLADELLQKQFIKNSATVLETIYNVDKLLDRRKAIYDN